ncbi:hypothetical protein vseg_012427 [Gypsophila vaccaria]
MNNNNMNNDNNSPTWEVLALVSYHLDPKTLAIASCVSKSWWTCFSNDALWAPLCSSHFPSLSAFSVTPGVPPRRLYGVGHEAARLRGRLPRKPSLSLDRLVFGVTVHLSSRSGGPRHVLNVVRPCMELGRDPHGTFRFEVDVEDEDYDVEWGVDELEGVRVTWTVVDKDWKAVFAMTEDSGAIKGGFSSSVDGWFSEELPTPWCCSGAMSSGLVADLRLEMERTNNNKSLRIGGNSNSNNNSNNNNNGNKMKIKKVKMGVMCIVNWRYLSVDDALSYLDHFLHV